MKEKELKELYLEAQKDSKGCGFYNQTFYPVLKMDGIEFEGKLHPIPVSWIKCIIGEELIVKEEYESLISSIFPNNPQF